MSKPALAPRYTSSCQFPPEGSIQWLHAVGVDLSGTDLLAWIVDAAETTKAEVVSFSLIML